MDLFYRNIEDHFNRTSEVREIWWVSCSFSFFNIASDLSKSEVTQQSVKWHAHWHTHTDWPQTYFFWGWFLFYGRMFAESYFECEWSHPMSVFLLRVILLGWLRVSVLVFHVRVRVPILTFPINRYRFFKKSNLWITQTEALELAYFFTYLELEIRIALVNASQYSERVYESIERVNSSQVYEFQIGNPNQGPQRNFICFMSQRIPAHERIALFTGVIKGNVDCFLTLPGWNWHRDLYEHRDATGRNRIEDSVVNVSQRHCADHIALPYLDVRIDIDYSPTRGKGDTSLLKPDKSLLSPGFKR